MKILEVSGLVPGGHPCIHLSLQLLLRTYRYCYQSAMCYFILQQVILFRNASLLSLTSPFSVQVYSQTSIK